MLDSVGGEDWLLSEIAGRASDMLASSGIVRTVTKRILADEPSGGKIVIVMEMPYFGDLYIKRVVCR